MNKQYIKQLEAENETLKKRLEVADLKAECYDVIMSKVVHKESTNNKGFITHSDINTDKTGKRIKGISLRVEIEADVNKSSGAVWAIIGDYLEDSKMMQGWDEK